VTGIADGANDNRCVAVVLKKYWVIDGHRVRVLNVEAAGFGDYAYDGSGTYVGDGKGLAERVFSVPVPAGKRFADNCDIALVRVEAATPGMNLSALVVTLFAFPDKGLGKEFQVSNREGLRMSIRQAGSRPRDPAIHVVVPGGREAERSFSNSVM
jgi:hypothetical protein